MSLANLASWVRDCLRVAVGGLRPKRLWQRIDEGFIELPSRFVRYWFASAFVAALGVGVALYASYYNEVARAQDTFDSLGYSDPHYLWSHSSSANQFLHNLQWSDWQWQQTLRDIRMELVQNAPVVIVAVMTPLLFAWPWLITAALLPMGSIYRGRASARQILQCHLCSFDGGLWLGLLGLPVGLTIFGWPEADWLLWCAFVSLSVAVVGMFLLGIYRLWVCYRHGLKLPQPWLAICIPHVLVLLLLATLFAFIETELV